LKSSDASIIQQATLFLKAHPSGFDTWRGEGACEGVKPHKKTGRVGGLTLPGGRDWTIMDMSHTMNHEPYQKGAVCMLINNVLLHVRRDDVENARGSVIITHGIAEHSGRYDDVVRVLNEAGFSVVRYDVRGHGQSQGRRGWVKSFHDPVDDLHALVLEEKKRNPHKLFLVGHSMGGLIVNVYAVKYGDVDGIVSSAAASWFVKDVMPLRIIGYRWLGFVKKQTDFADDQLSRIKEVEDAYVADPLNLKSFSIALAGQMMVGGVRYLNKHLSSYKTPVLFLHGGSDKIVPAAFSKRLHDLVPAKDKTLVIYPESYHEIFNDLDKETVYKDMTDWLQKRSEKDEAA
jgi:acylglycerol lipase